MNMNENRFVTLLLGFVVAILIAACAHDPAPIGKEQTWGTDDDRPAWTVKAPDHNRKHLYFVGVSGKYSSERAARDAAKANAMEQAAKYLHTLVDQERVETRSNQSPESAVIDTHINLEDRLTLKTHELLQSFTEQKWYIEQWVDEKDQRLWKAFVMASLPQSVSEKESDDAQEE
jgi:hypothetical protein